MKVILVCGYRRTGKDTLYQKLSNPNQENSGFSWKIYQHPDRIREVFDKESLYIRTAFADSLKIEAGNEYNIPVMIADADKDIKQFTHYKTGDMVSARDIYIEWGAIRRSQDPDYWCKAALNLSNSTENTWIVVTDWRFQNESEYVLNNFTDTITCRLYRSDIPEPDVHIESEHQLDSYATDLLLVRNDDEFKRTAIKFPQYFEYVPTGTVE